MKNDDRKHLTTREIEKLIEAAKGSRNEAPDRFLLLLTFRHEHLWGRPTGHISIPGARPDFDPTTTVVDHIAGTARSYKNPLHPVGLRCSALRAIYP